MQMILAAMLPILVRDNVIPDLKGRNALHQPVWDTLPVQAAATYQFGSAVANKSLDQTNLENNNQLSKGRNLLVGSLGIAIPNGTAAADITKLQNSSAVELIINQIPVLRLPGEAVFTTNGGAGAVGDISDQMKELLRPLVIVGGVNFKLNLIYVGAALSAAVNLRATLDGIQFDG